MSEPCAKCQITWPSAANLANFLHASTKHSNKNIHNILLKSTSRKPVMFQSTWDLAEEIFSQEEIFLAFLIFLADITRNLRPKLISKKSEILKILEFSFTECQLIWAYAKYWSIEAKFHKKILVKFNWNCYFHKEHWQRIIFFHDDSIAKKLMICVFLW